MGTDQKMTATSPDCEVVSATYEGFADKRFN